MTRLLRSFGYAWEGILHAYSTEQNIRIHTLIGILVCIVAFFLDVTSTEWMIIFILIAGMISLELLNTAIERTIDLVTKKEYHPLAKQAKDLSAAAVFIFAIVSVMIGLIIFMNKIVRLII
ncbi:diacylglycerol kinase family protein [Bacillus sp. DJP31]|uniref:diacylglycerol kinase family protein n=1 Tax=Bacillus sp. DJP31 TaxID=3409789 RepID=UPI003BB6F401